MDYNELGLKMGLEIHQQLNSEHKLFCPCKTELVDDDFDELVQRKLRPTQSELGEIDRAALQESLRGLNFKYENFEKHTCLVENDDEPPHSLNEEALDICITIACLMNMHIVDEFHTMRKQVIDGSNTGGFQRTGMVATDGYLDTPYGRVVIESLGLEEDAARRVETKDGFTEFRLDRLGIPLAEITTDPSMHHPDQVREVAYMLGQILRSTNVKRGLGTIRQDLNISIAEGARVEIKGVQDLDLMAEIVNREVTRQLELIDIRNELKNRNAEVLEEIHTLDELFEQTESKILKSAETIKAVVLKGFNGLIGREVQPDRRFGTEIASYAKKRGVSGIFHSDELPAYGITQDEVDRVSEFLNIGDDDAFIIVAHDEDIAVSALEEVKRRANLGLDGVVEDPTANRMYLETDIPLFKITADRIEPIANDLPELPDVKQARIIEEYKLSEDLATQLVKRQEADMFEDILAGVSVDATPVASLLAYDLREIKREGHDIDVLTLDHFKGIFTLLADGKIAKDSVRKLSIETIKNPDTDISEIAEKSNLVMMSEDDVAKIIAEIVAQNEGMVKERQMGAMGPLMGMCMKQLKGKADGGLVNKIVREEIQKIL